MNNRIKKTFLRQQGKSDCGVACLASVTKFHGGDISFERLRELSGTSMQGTTLLGLYNAATHLGFDAEGMEADTIDSLREISDPAILHVTLDGKFLHYLVFYGFDGNSRAIIGDPGEGLVLYSKDELNKVWHSKSLLRLVPNQSFQKASNTEKKKREWFVTLIKDDINILLLALVIGVFISMLGLSTAIFSQKLIDDILPSGNKNDLLFGIAIFTILLIVRGFLNYVRGIFLIRQAADFSNRIIQIFYGILLRLPKSFFDTRKIGELIARMNDTRRIQSTVSLISGNIIIDFLIALISISFIFLYSTLVGFVVLGCIPLYIIVLWLFSKKIANAQKTVMKSYADTESNYIDSIQGISVIKSANKESFFDGINGNVYGYFQTSIYQLSKLNISFGLCAELLSGVLIASVLGLSSYFVLSNLLQIGEMVALISIASSVFPSINRLAISNIQIQEARVAFERMYEFKSIEPEYQANPTSREECFILKDDFNLSIQNVKFRFPGRKLILKNANLNLQRGEIISLLGESGSGKSTLIQIIQKFYKAESGIINFNNSNIDLVPTPILRKFVGVVSQDVKIFNGSLLYNIAFGNEYDTLVSVISFCKQVGLDTFVESFPQGYQTIIGEEGVNLSGGQKQLVAITRALFLKPKILLLDEPTSAMDRNMERHVLNLLTNLKHQMAILLVTHRIEIALKSDRIYILEDGEITKFGSPNDLMTTKNLFSDSLNELLSSKYRHTH